MLFQEYVAQWKDVRLSNSGGWKKSQEQMLRDYILPVLVGIKMKSITHLHISKILNLAKDKGRSPQTLKHIYSLMNGMFTFARDEFEIIDKSPVRSKLHRPKVPKVAQDFLEPEDAKKILLGVLEFTGYRGDAQYSLPIWLGIFCGLRIGEIIGLKWGDVNLKGRNIHVRRAWDSKMNCFNNYTKNQTQIRVPMPDPLHDILKKLKDQNKPSDFVCQSRVGVQLSRHTFHKALKRICKKLGLIEISAHGMRHTCSELWIYHGASVEDVRRLLNHESVASTKGYVHRTESRLQAMAKTVTAGLKAA